MSKKRPYNRAQTKGITQARHQIGQELTPQFNGGLLSVRKEQKQENGPRQGSFLNAFMPLNNNIDRILIALASLFSEI